MKVTNNDMVNFLTDNPIKKVVFTPMIMGTIYATLFCENCNIIDVQIHDPLILKFFKWEFVLGHISIVKINDIKCSYSLNISDRNIKKMLFMGIDKEKKNHIKREENLISKIILKQTDRDAHITEVNGVHFVELRNHFDSTR